MALEVRPVSGIDELRRWVGVRNAVHPDDPDDAEQKVLLHAAETTHVDLIAYLEGAPAGVGMLAGDPISADAAEQYVVVAVLPEHRRHGVGGALLAELSRRARELGKTGLFCTARVDDAASVGFLERRGFVEGEHEERWSLDLVEPLRDPIAPAGVAITSLLDRPDALSGMYEVAKATASERGGFFTRQVDSLHDWHVYELGDSTLVLDLTTIALAGDEVVGFSTLRRVAGGDVAEARTIVVLPEWRRQGVASALVLTQAQGARAAGARRLLAVLRTPDAARFAAELGFEPESVTADYHGPLLDH